MLVPEIRDPAAIRRNPAATKLLTKLLGTVGGSPAPVETAETAETTESAHSSPRPLSSCRTAVKARRNEALRWNAPTTYYPTRLAIGSSKQGIQEQFSNPSQSLARRMHARASR